MCVACLAFSALTLFTPVSESAQASGVLQSATVQQAGVREITFTRREVPLLADQTQEAIAEFLNYLPTDPELELLRTGMADLSVALEAVTSDTEARQIIDDHLQTLQEQVFASPNSDRIIAVLRDIVIGDSELQLSQSQHFNWGWLS